MPCWGIIFAMTLLVNVNIYGSFPNNKFDDFDSIVDAFEYDNIEDELGVKNETDCGECFPELCPKVMGCRAGIVHDSCGCCPECGNLEGQSCDIDNKNVFFGLCGSNLHCKIDVLDLSVGEVPEPYCVCESQDALCGSDGKTYLNICQLKEASYSNPGLQIKSNGPCKTVPIIKVPPRNHVNVTGSCLVFLCEVFAFPMALVEWRKEGQDVILPGDDPHISVQSRGGPQKYELSSWLQMEYAGPADSGTYRCVARNELGSATAAAVVAVLGPDEMSAYLRENATETPEYDQPKEYPEDYY